MVGDAIRAFEKEGWHGSKGYHAGLLKAAEIADGYTLRQQLAERDAEILEQCRLNGMGAERELKLIAQRDNLAGLLRHASSVLGSQGWDALTHEIDAALAEVKS